MTDRSFGLILPNSFQGFVQRARDFCVEGEEPRDVAIGIIHQMYYFLAGADLPKSRERFAAGRYILDKREYTVAIATFQNIYRSDWRIKYGQQSDPERLVDKLLPKGEI